MASGDTLAIFTPHMNEPTTANFATLDLRNLHPVLNHDDTTNEYSVFSDVMPQNYAGTTGITAYIHYAMASAVADTIDWDLAFERIGDRQQDLDSDGFAAVQSVDNTTVPATSGLVDVVSIAFTDGAQMDSVAAGDGYRVKLNRDAANDDATGDGQLVFLELRET